MEAQTSTTSVQHTPRWTPGPWRVTGRTDIVALEGTPDPIVVASTQFFQGEPTERQLADARLIAATPEIMAVLKGALDYECSMPDICHGAEWHKDAHEVIAKAEGRQP